MSKSTASRKSRKPASKKSDARPAKAASSIKTSPEEKAAAEVLKLVDKAAGLLRQGLEEGARQSAAARGKIHKQAHSLLHRAAENGLLEAIEASGAGGIAFSPLAQGILAGRYNSGIPGDSRAASASGFLQPGQITENALAAARAVASLARERGETPAQLALAWVLRRREIASALIGASSSAQIRECAEAARAAPLTAAELARLDQAASE
ncbi:MAG: aldo/keto reductase [Terrimicrobiaceae bacterium]|nr:aldo/keto reductase [Terrimicrobiaceae bacterium]